jgi:hypothetical protein
MSAAIIQAPDIAQNVSVSVKLEDVAKELNLAPVKLRAPVYKQRRFTQVSGGTALTLSGSTTLSQFNIPGSSVWNFHKSYLTLDALCPIAAIGGAGTGVNVLFTDCLPIDSIQLQTASGQVLANLQNVQAYTKISQAMAIDNDEYCSRGPVYGDTILGTAYPISQITGCQPTNGYNTARASVLVNSGVPDEGVIIDVVAGGDVADVPSILPANNVSGTDIASRLAPQSYVHGTLDAASGLNVRYKIPFKAFLGTILAMDRNLYFGQNLQLVIYWKQAANWGFQVAALACAASTTAIFTSVSNYYLYLMEDVNSENVAYHRNEVNSKGMEILVPYTNCSQLSTSAAAGTYTISTPLTPGTGVALKRCITIPINAANTTKRTANNFNVGGVKFTQNQSTLDGRPLQDQFLVFANSDLWNYMSRLIKNSPVGMSQRTFEQNCFMMDNFSDADSSCYFYENDCKESGLRVPQAMTYENTFVQASTGGLILMQYQTWCRVLVINSSGIAWGNSFGGAQYGYGH